MLTSPEMRLDHGDLRRRLMLPIAVLFILAGVAIAVIVILLTREQDRVAREKSEQDVATLVEYSQRNLARLVLDYTWWDSAVRNLVIEFDPSWADDNLGAYLVDTFGISASFVVSGHDHPIFTVVEGEVRQDFDISGFQAAGLSRLITDARKSIGAEEPIPAVSAILVEDQMYLAAVSLITPEETDSPVSPDPKATLALVQRMDSELIPLLSEGLDLKDVSARTLKSETLPASTSVFGPEGKPIGVLTWRPEMPGSTLRDLLLPIVATTLLLVAGLVILHLVRVERTVRSIAGRKEQLHQAQKMQSLGQLTGGVAHEFNNLLMIVSVNLDLMEKAGATPPTYIERSRTAVSKGSALSQQLLSFARQESSTSTIVDVKDIVLSVKELSGGIIGERYAVKIHSPNDPWPVRVDRIQLEHALLNIVINARDAMPDGGEIEIVVSNVRVSTARAVGGMQLNPGAYVLIELIDHGCGMSPDVAQRAFEPFFTTKEVGQGTGLGLRGQPETS